MKQDRELLELAAKAAGYVLLTNGQVCSPEAGNFDWNPLTDDGDALRLAVKLGISIFPPQVPKQQGDFAVASLPGDDGDWVQEFIKNGDPYAATRRAIVQAAAAAAAIGEGK